MSKKEQIINEIRKIYDPELPVNIYELGLIYDIKVEDEKFAKENKMGMWMGTFIHPKKWRKLNR